MPERNPFEETLQAARDWSPREQYISRSNLPSYRAERSDNVPDYFNKPYTPSDNIPDPYPLGDNSGIRLAAANNARANVMMDDYSLFSSDYNTNADPYSFEAREPLRNWLVNQWIKKKTSEEDQNLLREQGHPLDAPIGFNFRTGQPGSNQGGGWTQLIPKPGDDMLNWQYNTKYGDFGFGFGDDKVGFNYKVGFGG